MNRLTKTIFLTALVFSPVAIYSKSISAEEVSPPGDSMFYYKIGGGRVFRAVPRWNITTIDLDFRASLTGLTCGGFDPQVSLRNSLNQVADGVDDMYNQLELAASAAIANLPGYILSKTNPNLYDIFMNAVAQAKATFELATKSCEKIEAEIRAGEDPFEEFMTVSIGDTWKAGVGTDGVDINDVEEIAESDARENGVAHPCHGRAGGDGQPQYQVLGDTVEVGYNRLLDRSACATSTVPVTPDSTALVKKFTNPTEISDWLGLVIGEVNVDISTNGEPSSQPGTGLVPLINDRSAEVFEELTDMYNGATTLTLPNLSRVSAPGVLITAQIIEGLRVLTHQEATIFMQRIADEVGVADTIDSALLVRRSLVTGRRETEIYANNNVVDLVDKAISEIDKEVDLIIKEHDIRKKLLGESLPVLLNMVSSTQNTSLSTNPVHHREQKQIEDGRVKN